MKPKRLNVLILILLLSVTTLIAAPMSGKILGGKDTTMPSWFVNSFMDISEDISELADKNKRLILFVHQANCPYCHRFVTRNLEDKDTKKKIDEHFGVVSLNMFGAVEVTDTNGESYSEKEFARKHKIQFTPTLIFFNEEGKQILRLNGYMPVEKFNIALDYVKDKKEKTLSYNEYIEQRANSKPKAAKVQKDPNEPPKYEIKGLFTKPTALFFESVNCTEECTKIHDLFLSDKVISELLPKIDIVSIDVNSKRKILTPDNKRIAVKDWVKDLKITYNPSVIFFDTEGKEIIRIESSFKKFHTQTIVDYVASGAFKDEPEFQRYLTKRANGIRARGIDVNIWE